MPPGKKHETAPPVSGTDRIGALPDHMLHHVLSFLPAQAAVRTCMLARRWRDLWRSTTGLRISGLDGPKRDKDFRAFVDHLLILRERTELDTFEIKYYGYFDDAEPYLKVWTRFAVMSKVRVLTLRLDAHPYHSLDDLPLASRHLRTLDLEGMALAKDFIDLASCPVLVDLKMQNCEFSAGKISSRSMKHLSITSCSSDSHRRIHVCTPALVSLNLVRIWGRTPFLENMTLLESASIHLDYDCEDVCFNYDYESGVFCGADNSACQNCGRIDDDCSSDLVLLGGISSAKHLELISEFGKFIFARDLKHCPTFSKLRTLLLNEYWCEAPGLGPLACILKNSPVLLKLTLQLFSQGKYHNVEMKGSYSSTERSSAISEHLKIVEIKCNVVNEKVLKVLEFMYSFGIRFNFEKGGEDLSFGWMGHPVSIQKYKA